MKHFILLFAFILGINSYSQEQKSYTNFTSKNELKLNVAYLIAGYPEILFEQVLTSETSLGISLSFAIDNKSNEEENNAYNFSLIPYYRVYFGEKPNAGFFVEANLTIYSQKKTAGDIFSSEKKGGTGFGIGFNVGKKYRTKNGWIGEFSFGVSRTLVNSDKVNLLYPRAGIIIGKLF